jgi:hypothetical protein
MVSRRTWRLRRSRWIMVDIQTLACVAALSAKLPRASHTARGFPCGASSAPTPQPPPPGVSINSRSPLPMSTVPFPPMFTCRGPWSSSATKSRSSSRLCLIHVFRPISAASPPSTPYGARVRRYGIMRSLSEIREMLTRLAQDRHLKRVRHFKLPDHTIPATPLAVPT